LPFLGFGLTIKLLYNRRQLRKSIIVSKNNNSKSNSKAKRGSKASDASRGRRAKSSSKQDAPRARVSRHRKPETTSSSASKPNKFSSKASTDKRRGPGDSSGRRTRQVTSVDTQTRIPNKVTFVEIDENHDGQRLDNFLITHLKGVPKSHIYRIIRKGEVRINKGRVKQTTRLKEGDSLRLPPIRLSDEKNSNLDGEKYRFLGDAILFEDDALMVINKPCGMAVHAGSGIAVGVIEALRAYRNDLKYIELVHRLDRETSGVLVLAKKASALKILHDDFKTNSLKNPRLDKRYLTLVKGQWQHGQRRVTKALNVNARRHGERYVVVDADGSYASSIMTPKAVSKEASLIEVKLLTGRTHQVRVHAQSENHPVAGDPKYGDDDFNKKMKSVGLSRLFLHAARLKFVHPLNQRSLTIEAPLPHELLSVLNNLSLEPN